MAGMTFKKARLKAGLTFNKKNPPLGGGFVQLLEEEFCASVDAGSISAEQLAAATDNQLGHKV